MKLRFAALSLLALTLATSAALACGPDLPWAVFTHARHPDLPLNAYAGGQLGVLQSGYARSYLCVAYRWLSGVPLTSEEQAQALGVWRERSEHWWESGLDDRRAPGEWLSARERVPGLPPVAAELAAQMRDTTNAGAFSAGTDAFRTATRVLLRRLAAEGEHSPLLRAWVLAQDTVFAISAGEALEFADTPALRADPDRLYQLGAVAFHAGDWDTAEPLFRTLAGMNGTRMAPLARYLAVRCVVRRAQGDDEESPLDQAALARADAELAAMLADPSQHDVHRAARRLRAFVAYRLRPVARLAELSQSLRAEDADYGQDLWDFTLLLDGIAQVADAPQTLAPSRAALTAAGAQDELADWVLTFQRGPEGAAHAIERWDARQTLPWLVAALAAAPASAVEADRLLSAAAAVPASSPAYAVLAAHRARLLASRGDANAARAVLDAVLAPGALPVGSRNALLAQRAALAPGLAAWLADLPRVPAEVVYGTDEPAGILTRMSDGAEPDSAMSAMLAMRHTAACFDADGAAAFNLALPLPRWQEAVAAEALPERMRRSLALAGWTRAVLLGDSASARVFAPYVRTLVPALAADMDAWADATTGESRAFAAALLIARRPGMQPFVNAGLNRLTPLDQLDDYRENWWASRESVLGGEFDGSAVGEAATGGASRASIHAAAPAFGFLSAAERAEAAAQLASLAHASTAPNWLGDRILAFARTHPSDPRVPESLHRLVRAVRLGESDTRSATLARTAFRLLHTRYPASPWTRRTKSWGV